MRQLIEKLDLVEIEKRLAENPQLANEGIPLHETDLRMAHPLHRICDHVFNNVYTDDDAVELATLFLKYGANVDGYELVIKNDTPLIAAASLHAEKTAILYMEHGANIHHQGCHGGTALHWSAWVGRDKLVKLLIDAGADIHLRDIEFNSTPLFWAIHGYKAGGEKNRYNQVECARLLLQAGADKTATNAYGKQPIELLDTADAALLSLFQ